jgi:hypothetical protein
MIDTELYLRMQRRNMVLILLITLAAGGFLVASTLWPDAAPMRGIARASYLIPIAIIIGVGVQQTIMRKQGLKLDTPEFKAVLDDEWRRRSMEQATRGALIATLVAQIVLPLAFVRLPAVRAVWGMSAATITIGMAAQVALFLFFNRD